MTWAVNNSKWKKLKSTFVKTFHEIWQLSWEDSLILNQSWSNFVLCCLIHDQNISLCTYMAVTYSLLKDENLGWGKLLYWIIKAICRQILFMLEMHIMIDILHEMDVTICKENETQSKPSQKALQVNSSCFW